MKDLALSPALEFGYDTIKTMMGNFFKKLWCLHALPKSNFFTKFWKSTCFEHLLHFLLHNFYKNTHNFYSKLKLSDDLLPTQL